MCSISTNRTARQGLDELERIGHNKQQQIEKRLFRIAQEASLTQKGLLEKPENLLRHMPDDLKAIKHFRLGDHRIYFTGANSQCSYSIWLLKINKKAGVLVEGSPAMNRMMRAALEDPQDQVLQPEIPDSEVSLLQTAIDEAAALAHAGLTEEGYQKLCSGRDRAEVLLADGEPWAGEMLDHWKIACTDYGFTYRVVQPDNARKE